MRWRRPLKPCKLLKSTWSWSRGAPLVATQQAPILCGVSIGVLSLSSHGPSCHLHEEHTMGGTMSAPTTGERLDAEPRGCCDSRRSTLACMDAARSRPCFGVREQLAPLRASPPTPPASKKPERALCRPYARLDPGFVLQGL